MKKIAILGSTGSIGTQTLEIVRTNGDLEVTALAAGNNIDLLEKQIREFKPKLAAVWKEERANELKDKINDLDVKVVSGMDGLLEVARQPESEILVTAIVGMIGILPTIEAINAGKDIALANKETLVTAGHIIMPLAKEKGVSILPVDSEHSAIFQSLQGGQQKALHKILLTASGGPFRGKKLEDLANIQVEDALKHPNWAMGRKITIDSSTMVNKGLEVIEAKWLFGVDVDQIQVVVQPQSIIHSMVQYRDGSVLAQMGQPDMRTPIAHALGFPERVASGVGALDFSRIGELSFLPVDFTRYPCLKLAIEACWAGQGATTALNAANEIAVDAFLGGKIGFTDIYRVVAEVLTALKYDNVNDLDTILTIDSEARHAAQQQIARLVA